MSSEIIQQDHPAVNDSIPEDASSFYQALGRQMAPEVLKATVEECHEAFLLRNYERLGGRIWLRGRESDTLAVIKGYHFLRSMRAGEAISAQQFCVATVLDVIRHAMDRSVAKLVDDHRVFIVRVQRGHYPSTVTDMLLDALRLRHAGAPKATTWVVTEGDAPEGLSDSFGWVSLHAYLSTFTGARAPEGTLRAPSEDPSDVVPWGKSKSPARCTQCSKQIKRGARFTWANAIGLSEELKKMVCESCTLGHLNQPQHSAAE